MLFARRIEAKPYERLYIVRWQTGLLSAFDQLFEVRWIWRSRTIRNRAMNVTYKRFSLKRIGGQLLTFVCGRSLRVTKIFELLRANSSAGSEEQRSRERSEQLP